MKKVKLFYVSGISYVIGRFEKETSDAIVLSSPGIVQMVQKGPNQYQPVIMPLVPPLFKRQKELIREFTIKRRHIVFPSVHEANAEPRLEELFEKHENNVLGRQVVRANAAEMKQATNRFNIIKGKGRLN